MIGRIVGADIAALKGLARSIDEQAGRLENLSARLSSAIANPSWKGADATRFRAEWRSSHVVKLRSVSAALREAAKVVLAEAAQQERASAAAGGGLGGQGAGFRPHRITAKEYASLAVGVEAGGKAVQFDGHSWTPLDADELKRLGIDPGMLNDHASGFHATVYRSEDGSYVVSFDGTDFNDKAGDVTNDVVGALPAALSRQTELAVSLAQTLDVRIDGELSFVGHSLGGRLAALSAIATDRHAVTFNAAGVSDSEFYFALVAAGRDGHMASNVIKAVAWTGVEAIAGAHGIGVGDGPNLYASEREELSHRVTNFVGTKDPLSWLQQNTSAPDAVGEQVRVQSSSGDVRKGHDVADMMPGLPGG